MDADGIRDLFQELGPVRVRRMFGGQGIYFGELMFALVSDGELYLKADEEIRPDFERAGSRPFVYEKGGKPVALSYWLMPGEALDDPSEAARWAQMAVAASRRAATRSRTPRRIRLT